MTPGKEEDEHALAVDGLRLGNLIAYSSSKMCFFGFTNLSLACSRCDFNSCLLRSAQFFYPINNVSIWIRGDNISLNFSSKRTFNCFVSAKFAVVVALEIC